MLIPGSTFCGIGGGTIKPTPTGAGRESKQCGAVRLKLAAGGDPDPDIID